MLGSRNALRFLQLLVVSFSIAYTIEREHCPFTLALRVPHCACAELRPQSWIGAWRPRASAAWLAFAPRRHARTFRDYTVETGYNKVGYNEISDIAK
uniref:Putative secreted protein n=1 Tax=Ixodes ricinus TaxID=34613 RepID=A0A147BED9_IXORI